jgi:hypothetical protein
MAFWYSARSQTADRVGATGIGVLFRGAIERGFQLRQRSSVHRFRGPLFPRRRHLPPAQPTNNLLPNLGVRFDRFSRNRIQIQLALGLICAVAIHAKRVDRLLESHVAAKGVSRQGERKSGRKNQGDRGSHDIVLSVGEARIRREMQGLWEGFDGPVRP